MRLAEGIIVDKEKTFGRLRFSAMRRESFYVNEDGTVSTELKARTYDLKSREQGQMIQVSLPPEIPVRDFPYNAEVDLIDPIVDTVAEATYQGADVKWYIKASDIILKKPAGNPQQPINPQSSNQPSGNKPKEGEK